jgi:hypothetical protein
MSSKMVAKHGQWSGCETSMLDEGGERASEKVQGRGYVIIEDGGSGMQTPKDRPPRDV